MCRTIVILGLLGLLLLLSGETGQTFARSPMKFDEYGNLRSCDHSARLDNYAIQLQNSPGAYGYVVVYAPESAGKLIRQNIVDYLVKMRGLPAKRIKTIHAGYNEPLTEPLVQLWIIPEDTTPPKPLKACWRSNRISTASS